MRNINLVLILVLMIGLLGFAQGDDGNLHINGMLPIAIDIPHIYAVFRHNPGGPALPGSEFAYLDAYLDTGASGLIVSRETWEALGITAEPNAQFADVGVAGKQLFNVSTPLYLSLADYDAWVEPTNSDFYYNLGPWRLMMTLQASDDPLDVLGVPAMAGKSVVFIPSDIEQLRFFSAALREPNDPSIPASDFSIKLRYANFLYRNDPDNYGPLPVLGYNPVIDDVTISYHGLTSQGTWLLDTGASSSMISFHQAALLGLTDEEGNPIVEPDLIVPIGGIGGQLEAPGYRLDHLTVSTLQGWDLVYDQAYVLVVNIGTRDEQTGAPIILDGVWGCNLMTETADLDFNIVTGPYDQLVLNTDLATLGFKVKDFVSLPTPVLPHPCGFSPSDWRVEDVDRNCRIDLEDWSRLSDEWLGADCGVLNWHCAHADINRDGQVNIGDLALLAESWLAAHR